MSILVDRTTKVVTRGMTGGTGLRIDAIERRS
jgi:hypothetical protein